MFFKEASEALIYALENPLFCETAKTLARNKTISDFDNDVNFQKIFDLVVYE